jgi:hypothetical protein
MAIFFLYVTVVKPSGSGSAVGLGGEIPTAATSLFNNSAKVVLAGIGSAANHEWKGQLWAQVCYRPSPCAILPQAECAAP